MRTIVAHRYGSPEVLQIEEAPEPSLAEDTVLVQVHATSVTTAEWRMRAGDFGGGLNLLGRAMFGFFRPRTPITGREFAGRVVAVGSGVRRFSVGDDVFGTQAGANAERIAVPESGVVTRMPRGLSHAEAVALPFGGLTALDFLEDRAAVQAGERVLIVGASGGVGTYLVQVAKAAGAAVTGVCSADNADFVRELGAETIVDYRTTDLRELSATFDVLVDTVGKTSSRTHRHLLSETGRHVFIEGGLGEMLRSMLPRLGGGPRVISGVTADTREAFERLRDRVERGDIRPIVGHRFPMEQAVDAHRLVDARHRRGAVVLDFAAGAAVSMAAE